MAKKAEDKAEAHAGRVRAQRFLQQKSPTYMQDIDYLGVGAEDEKSTEFSGDGTATDGETETESRTGDESETASRAEEREERERLKAEGGLVDPRARARAKVLKDNKQLLVSAAHGGLMNLWNVRRLLRTQHVRTDHRDGKGRCALYVAAEHGNIDIMEAILGNRCKVDNATHQKWTPLHAATFHGQIKCIDRLLKAAANANAKDQHGCTPLMLAASSPKLYIVDLVSAADRAKRRKARRNAFEKQMKLDLEKDQPGKKSKQALMTDPRTMWKYYPNRIELIVMNALLKQKYVEAAVDQMDNQKRSAMTYAARWGRTFAVSRLLAAKASIKHEDSQGRNPLFHAASNGHLEVAEMLIRVGSSVNKSDMYVISPLHAALDNQDDPMVNLLLKAEASVNSCDCDGRVPIMIAMDTVNRRIFGTLVERRSDLDVCDRRGWNVIMYAVETGMLGEVLPLLAKAGDRAKEALRLYDPQGRNTLHHAAFHQDVTMASQCTDSLIKLDPDGAKIGDCNGDSAVHLAAELGRLDVLRLMIEKLGQVNFRNHRKETPLMYAAHGGHLASVIALVQDFGKGPASDAAMVDAEGRTLLMHACASGHLDLVNLILQNMDGIHPELCFPLLDVNAGDNHGITALMVACSEGHWQLLPSLVLAGANKAAKDMDGFTALHVAAIEDEVLCASVLLDLGLDPNISDAKGWTPLMHAAWRGSDDVVQLLVDAGASLGRKNYDADTALQICLRRKDSGAKVTRDILMQGLLSRDEQNTHAVPAHGHFMITVIGAKDLYHEGKADQINTYILLELRSQRTQTPLVAFTTCVVKDGAPHWQEEFRFDTKALDTSAYLVAWVISAPGEEFEDICKGAELGLTEAQLEKASMARKLRGLEEGKDHLKMDFKNGMEKAFRKQMQRADARDDMEVERQKRVELMAKKPDESTFQRHDIPYQERCWNEVENMRKYLGRAGVNISDPLVPRTHLPLGCLVIRFRELRASVWHDEPVVVDRKLRLACRGSLRLEVDFRPRYFHSTLPAMANLNAEEFEPRTPRQDDLEESLETAVAAKLAEKQKKLEKEKKRSMIIKSGVDKEAVGRGRARAAENPEYMYRRFMQVSVWASSVLAVRKRLTNDTFQTDQEELARQAGLVAKLQSAGAYVKWRYKKMREFREHQREVLDQKVLARAIEPPKRFKTAPKAQPGKKRGEVPVLNVEPWLEEVIQGSRFFG